MPIYEILLPSREFKDAMITGDRKKIAKVLQKERHKSLWEAGRKLLASGKTTIAEIQRVLGEA